MSIRQVFHGPVGVVQSAPAPTVSLLDDVFDIVKSVLEGTPDEYLISSADMLVRAFEAHGCTGFDRSRHYEIREAGEVR